VVTVFPDGPVKIFETAGMIAGLNGPKDVETIRRQPGIDRIIPGGG
jgi:hypothetical protein